MKCLNAFMRKGCKRRRSSEIGKADRVDDSGAMVDTIAPDAVEWLLIMLLFKKQSQEIAKVC